MCKEFYTKVIMPETLASGKVVFCEQCTELSETILYYIRLNNLFFGMPNKIVNFIDKH